MMRALVAIIGTCVGLAVGVLGYGWWHSSRHATVSVTLRDAAEPRRFEQLKGAQLAFLDGDGRVLARGKTDEKFGTVWISHPSVGYCGPELAQTAYAECFRAHTTWLLTWIRAARYISVATPRCRIEGVPIYFAENRDSMWTWWIPLPHVGGTPYTHFDAFVQVNNKTCSVVPFRG